MYYEVPSIRAEFEESQRLDELAKVSRSEPEDPLCLENNEDAEGYRQKVYLADTQLLSNNNLLEFQSQERQPNARTLLDNLTQFLNGFLKRMMREAILK